MAAWHEFASAAPALAAAGEQRLFQFGVGLAFLATIRKDGGPRVHPVCPVLCSGHLYILIQPASPKRRDLRRDGRYALQAFPPPKEESEEFYLAGRAVLQEDPVLREAVFREAKHRWHPDEVLFELTIERAMHTRWERWGTPQLHPVHQQWQARAA
jgi:hypothetical protein